MLLSLAFVLMLASSVPGEMPQAAAESLPQAAPAPSPKTPAAPSIALSAAVTLRCTFPNYAATRWIDGTPETVTGTDELAFDIDAINLRARTATIVALRGTALVSAFVTSTGLNVIEQTPGGNFILTSVFNGGREGNRLRAVHARHLGDANDLPAVSQYFGTCEIAR
jgi:hypothetical protein